jgi:hypothetical protein
MTTVYITYNFDNITGKKILRVAASDPNHARIEVTDFHFLIKHIFEMAREGSRVEFIK